MEYYFAKRIKISIYFLLLIYPYIIPIFYKIFYLLNPLISFFIYLIILFFITVIKIFNWFQKYFIFCLLYNSFNLLIIYKILLSSRSILYKINFSFISSLKAPLRHINFNNKKYAFIFNEYIYIYLIWMLLKSPYLS